MSSLFDEDHVREVAESWKDQAFMSKLDTDEQAVKRVSKIAKVLLSNEKTICPKCGLSFFAPYQKLYIPAFGECYLCSDAEVGEHRRELIFDLFKELKGDQNGK